MSNFLAVATVTAVLKDIVLAAARRDVTGVEIGVSTRRPDSTPDDMPAHGVNIFLYQVTPNAARRNDDLPTRRADGTLVTRPRAALDLHYLLTFYGDEAAFEPQRLLGGLVRTLHAQPLLSREQIRRTLSSGAYPSLATSDLAEAVDMVRFTPQAVSLDDLSKLWSVLLQTPYDLSIVYQASVVLIEDEAPTQAALPVRDRTVTVVPFRRPAIDAIRSQTAPGAPILADVPILAGDRLVLDGRDLQADDVTVRVGGLLATPAAADVTATQVIVAQPPGLLAGVQPVQVVQRLALGTPPIPTPRASSSNVAAYVLHPTVTGALTPISSRVVDGVTLWTADLEVTFTPPAGVHQRVAVLLNEYHAPADRPAHAFSYYPPLPHPAPNPNDPTTPALTQRLTDVPAGTYVLRVQVDGAESPLTPDADGRFAQPQVTL